MLIRSATVPSCSEITDPGLYAGRRGFLAGLGLASAAIAGIRSGRLQAGSADTAGADHAI